MAPKPIIPNADKTTMEAQDSASTRRVAQLTGHLAPADETEKVDAHPTASINYAPSRLQLDPGRFIDRVRPVKVAVIGAGLAGINAGILLPAKVPGIQLTIFEKNTDVVSALRLLTALSLTFPRAVHGWKISTLVFDATYPRMYINQLFRQTPSGPRYSPKALKSATTGKRKRRSTVSTIT